MPSAAAVNQQHFLAIHALHTSMTHTNPLRTLAPAVGARGVDEHRAEPGVVISCLPSVLHSSQQVHLIALGQQRCRRSRRRRGPRRRAAAGAGAGGRGGCQPQLLPQRCVLLFQLLRGGSNDGIAG